MSDVPSPTPPDSNKPASAGGSEPQKKKRRWPRRLRILVLLLLFLMFASRAVVVVLLPPVLHHVAGFYGLDATYQRLELSILSGDTGLWNLVITPKGGGEPIATVDYCRGDISPLALMRGRLAVWRVEADGVNLALDRDADGSVPLLNLIRRNLPNSAAPTPAAQAKATSPYNFTPPLRLDALRLTHIKIHLRDRAVAPPLDAVVNVGARLSNLGDKSGLPTTFSADIDADPFLDALHVNGEGRTNNGTLDATFNAAINGLRLRPLAPYLAALGIQPMANETTLHARGELLLGPSASNANAAMGKLTLENVALLADGEEAAGIDHLSLDAPALDPHRLTFGTLALHDVRFSGRRSATGNIRFAGLEFTGSTNASNTSTSTATLPIIDLPLLQIRNLSARFHDDAVSPPADLAAIVDQFDAKNFLMDAANPQATVDINGVAHLPGIAGNAHLEGSLQPMAATKSLKLNIAADQIALDAIKPYLDPLGITSTIHNGAFTAAVAGDMTLAPGAADINASINDVRLKAPDDLLAMDHIVVRHARLASNATSLDDISISGPKLTITHDTNHTVVVAGFRFDPSRVSPRQPAATSSQPPAATPSISTLAAVAVKHFRWDGIDIAYNDLSLAPPVHTHITDAGVEYRDSTFHAWAKAPKIVEQLSVDGSVNAIFHGAVAQVTLNASGIDSTLAGPFLKPFHIEPTLRSGAIHADARANLITQDRGIDGTLSVANVSYKDGDTELAGVDRLAIDGLQLTPNSLTVNDIQIAHPRATVTRESDDVISGAGLRLLPAAFVSAGSSAPATAPSSPAAFAVGLGSLHLTDGSLRLIDQVKSTDTTATAARLDVRQLALNSNTPATLSLTGGISGVIDQANIDGSITPNPDSPAADLSVQAQNIRVGQLAAYLPPGLTIPLHDGRFQSKLQVSVGPAPDGGNAAKFVVTDLDYRQAGDQSPLLKLASARAIARRVDLAANVYDLSELSTNGVELSAARTPDGGFRALGVQYTPAPPAPKSKTTAAARAAAASVALSTTAPAAVAPASLQSLLATTHKQEPTITLDTLNVNLAHITLSDEMRPAAAPLEIQNLQLRNLDPISCGGHDRDAHPPARLRITGALSPAVGSFTVNAATTPLAWQPMLTLDLLASDIHGDGVLALVPELRHAIDAKDLTAGELRMHAETTARFSHRGESRIDYTAPFDLDVEVKPLAFRSTPGGPIIAGVDEIHSDGVHIEPGNGSIHVKAVEITNPIGRLSREKDGLHALGVVVLLPQSATKSAAPTTQVAAAQKSPAAAPLSNPTTAPALRPTKPEAEIRVDHLIVSDVDFIATDNTVNPPLVIPLNGLDVEVRDFTNFAPYEDRPVKFSAIVNAGKVPLPKPLASSGVAGAIGDAAALLSGKKIAAKRRMEDRELFAEASANGSIGLYPAPNGYIKTSLGGFELAALSSTAEQYGESLSDGVFDSTVDAKLPGDGTINTQAKFIFTDLAISEPPNGPIFRYLHLPAPLDAVLAALRDPEGSITVPLDFPVKNQTLSADALTGPAISAFGSIVATAIASTPMKVAGGIGDIFGLGGKKTAAPEPPLMLTFDAGDVTLSAADQAALDNLRARLINNPRLTVVVKHVLGGGDVADAQRRANPSPQTAQQLAQQMRQQQLVAAQLRSQLEGIVRSDLARGAPATDDLERLREVNRQMAQTDNAMDLLFDLLRPGADRMAGRRTRAACLSYGKERLAAIRSVLTDGAPPDLADRIHLLTPQYTQPADDAGGVVLVQIVGGSR